jgi:alginate O-acetyltransferase complex protein AlgJ
VLVLLVLPAAAMLFTPIERASVAEARMLAPVPAWPSTGKEWLELPRVLDAFARDHYGFRLALVQAHTDVRKFFGGEKRDNAVVEGEDGRLFLYEGLLASTGAMLSNNGLPRTSALLCEMNERLKARNIVFLYAMAPNPATIFPEHAPEWARATYGPEKTRYDRAMQDAEACGVKTVDLRPALLAAKQQFGDLYRRYDTHWNPRGKLAGFNAVVTAMGKPEWQLQPKQWKPETVEGGDLLRLAGMETRKETFDAPDLAPLGIASLTHVPLAGVAEYQEAPAFTVKGLKAEGPGILIIGDSYTQFTVPELFAIHARQVTWIHHQRCGFDWNVIERTRPDYVVFMPVARFDECQFEAPVNWATNG